ncbi:preprotein translocase subunit SecG [Geothermobacter hydrogeniphilus]|uniref:Protein-export membrane protein SecG n=1 Tax=Geothermobacter hydrogeniphilus TaxID=1969733 RepID=A0A1X0XLE3_9BACT|nr:preprotein translocase subunit SecG [Geothermobacter hydrogeniphilus]ORJ53706.1 preprotein translocase subunit SecG [Geothermobacter hydrogeniphilus]
MVTFLVVLHVFVCLALIAIVLVQGSGKGAEMGASFGAGSSQTVFGATGGQTFMAKLTTGAAVIFMLTSLILAYFHGLPGASSVMPEQVAPTAQEAPATPAAPAPTAEKAAPAADAKK